MNAIKCIEVNITEPSNKFHMKYYIKFKWMLHVDVIQKSILILFNMQFLKEKCNIKFYFK